MMEKNFKQARYVIAMYLKEKDRISPLSQLFGLPDSDLCTKYLGS